MTLTAPCAIAAPIAMIFAVNDAFVLGALDGLTHTQVWQRPTDRNNPMLWIAGHVVQTRAMLLAMLGEPVQTGWGDMFDRGARLGPTDSYPSIDDIARIMRDVSPRLHARLGTLDDAALARPGSMGLPFAKTLADELGFFAMHDSYHVGQMAYLRKGLGYPGLADV